MCFFFKVGYDLHEPLFLKKVFKSFKKVIK